MRFAPTPNLAQNGEPRLWVESPGERGRGAQPRGFLGTLGEKLSDPGGGAVEHASPPHEELSAATTASDPLLQPCPGQVDQGWFIAEAAGYGLVEGQAPLVFEARWVHANSVPQAG